MFKPKTEHTAWSAFQSNSSLMIHCVDEVYLYGIVQQDSNSIPTGIVTEFLAWILA